MSKQSSSKKNSKISGIIGVPQQLFTTPETTGLDHPYDIEYDFTSQFTIVFRGCFVCGDTDYFRTSKYPVGINSKEEKRSFLKELRSYKPHTKKKNKEGFSVSAF